MAPTFDHIVEVIIDLLAQDARRSPEELRAEVSALGEELPIDSLLAAEVLARVEEIFGVRMQATVETSQNLRSIHRFALAIHALAVEEQLRPGATA